VDSRILIGQEGFRFGHSDGQEDNDDEDSDEDSDERSDFDQSFSGQQRSDFVNGLPASLEDLTIRYCTDAIFDCSSGLLLLLIAKLLKLRKLKVGSRARAKVGY
jgi:hypothetical protein